MSEAYHEAHHEAPHEAAHLQHPPSGDTLAELLRSAAQSPEMTPRQRWQQRVGFAYGNVTLHNPAVTRDGIAVARFDNGHVYVNAGMVRVIE